MAWDDHSTPGAADGVQKEYMVDDKWFLQWLVNGDLIACDLYVYFHISFEHPLQPVIESGYLEAEPVCTASGKAC